MQNLYQGKTANDFMLNCLALAIFLIIAGFSLYFIYDSVLVNLDLQDLRIENILPQIKSSTGAKILVFVIFFLAICWEIMICLWNICLILRGWQDYLRINSYELSYACITNIWGNKSQGKIKWTDIEQITVIDLEDNTQGASFAIRVNTKIRITYRDKEKRLSRRHLFYQLGLEERSNISMQLYKAQKAYCRHFDNY